jgi:hypothetical protein
LEPEIELLAKRIPRGREDGSRDRDQEWADIDQPPSIAFVSDLERSFATFERHVDAVAVDDLEPAARSRRERHSASFVEYEIHTCVAGLTQISTFQNAATINAIGKRWCRSGPALPRD